MFGLGARSMIGVEAASRKRRARKSSLNRGLAFPAAYSIAREDRQLANSRPLLLGRIAMRRRSTTAGALALAIIACHPQDKTDTTTRPQDGAPAATVRVDT